MDDILSLIGVILVFVISAAGSRKNREKKRQKKLERQQRRAADARHAQPAAAGAGAAQASAIKPEPRTVQARPAMQREPDCEKRPLHLHSVSRMEDAGEGEDPCHPGRGPAAIHDDALGDQPSNNELAQELLRGIIVSEILTRPCERMARQRNQRRA